MAEERVFYVAPQPFRDVGEARAECERLYEELRNAPATGASGSIDDLEIRLSHQFPAEVPDFIAAIPIAFISMLVSAEPMLHELGAAPQLRTMTLEQLQAYRLDLSKKVFDRQHRDKILDQIIQLTLDPLMSAIMDAIKYPLIAGEDTPFKMRLGSALSNPATYVQRVYDRLISHGVVSLGLFEGFRKELDRNLKRASGYRADEWVAGNSLTEPSQSKLLRQELYDTYLTGTPFWTITKAPLPIKMPRVQRFAHTQIVGGTGAGKTSLLETLIINDLQDPKKPAVIVIDPHSDLVQRLARLDLGFHDRLTLIDPNDVDHPPAINIFDVDRSRLSNSIAAQEQVAAGITETFNYLFKGLGVELTGKQQTLFRFLARLIVSLPNPTIKDVLALMKDATPYQDAIAQLPDIPREFFETDFVKSYADTKDQVRQRLQAVISSDILGRIFSSPVNRVDFFKEMNQGGVILIDGADNLLSDNGPTFVKFVISLIRRAIKERATLPENQRHPTFIYIDEAWKFFDENIDSLLTEARKYNVGLILAHQQLSQASSALQSSLAASTAIKFASRVEATDARSLAANMRTTPEFILSQPRYQWATYISDATPHAISIEVDKPKEQPKFSPTAYGWFLERNAARISASALSDMPSSSRPPWWPARQPSASPQSPDDDISEKW